MDKLKLFKSQKKEEGTKMIRSMKNDFAAHPLDKKTKDLLKGQFEIYQKALPPAKRLLDYDKIEL